MKVSKIVADVEYLQPKGTKDCKTGWNLEAVGAKLAEKSIVSEGWAGPGKEIDSFHSDPDFIETDTRSLREQLKDGKGLRPTPLKAEMELVG